MKEDTQSKCYHCGGVLTLSDDAVFCLMCGRPVGHKCKLCINLPKRKVSVGRKPAKPAKKVRRKKAGVN